jgi:O-methyltransferase
MNIATLKISNSNTIAFLKSLTPPFLWQGLFKYFVIKNIPHANCYHPHYSPWLEKDFQLRVADVHAHTGLSGEKLYYLDYFARTTLRLKGCVAELGVWKGGGAKFIADIFRDHAIEGKKFYLFDSFEGMKVVNPYQDRHRPGEFSDTSYEKVKALMASQSSMVSVVMLKGWVPITFAGLEEEIFSFVHIDLDLYQPISDSLNFIYPRLVIGGVIVFDDYGYASCPGAKKAVDEFCKNLNKSILILPTGQAVLVKDSAQ